MVVFITAVTVVAASALVSLRPRSIERAVLDLVIQLPGWLTSLAEIAAFASALWAVVLVIGVAANGTRSLDLLRDIAIVVVGTVLGALALSRVVDGGWTGPVDLARTTSPLFPVLRTAIITGVAVVSAPHFTRPVRRVGALAAASSALAAIVLAAGSTSDAIGGMALGVAAASAVLAAFGSPLGYPDLSAISEALSRLGLQVSDLAVRDDRSWGERLVEGRLGDDHVEIKVLGRDAEGAAALARYWRAIWYRGTGSSRSASRVRAVEHEALLTVVAEREGVPVADVRGFGLAGDDVAIIVLDRPAGSLADLAADPRDQALEGLWHALRNAHGADLIHGSPTAESILTDGRQAWLTDWNDASAYRMEAEEGGAERDIVTALFAVASITGAARAVATSRSVLGDSALEAALPYLQLPAIPHRERSRVKNPKALMSQLRDALCEQLGVEAPPPIKLRRVSWGQIAMLALVFVAANALIGMLGGIDFAAVAEVLQNADWTWIVVGFIVAQTVFLPDATAMLFAVGRNLPMLPLTVLQVAVKFIGLAVPSAAGRVAMNAAFLHKHGVSATIATTQGAVDGLAGFLVEATVLLLALVFGDLALDVDTADLNWALILAVIVLLGIGAVVVITRVQKLQDVVLPVVKEAAGLFADIARDPRRAAGLLGSNLASRVVLGICLWFVLQGIGTPLPLISALVATVATNLLAGLVPIPGGIGVAEATMTAILVVFGIPEDAAFAAAVVYRVQTFYIPAVAGFPATRWLQRRDYL